jgi:hypothetical protein
MGQTPGGLRHPDGTDKVVDGDNAITNLAYDLDNRGYGRRTEARTITVTANGAGGFGFDFARPFLGTPTVVLTSANNSAGSYMLVAALLSPGPSWNRVEAWVVNLVWSTVPYVGPFSISYIAIGPDSI